MTSLKGCGIQSTEGLPAGLGGVLLEERVLGRAGDVLTLGAVHAAVVAVFGNLPDADTWGRGLEHQQLASDARHDEEDALQRRPKGGLRLRRAISGDGFRDSAA